MHYSLGQGSESGEGQAELCDHEACDQQVKEGAKVTRLHAALLAYLRAYVTVLIANVRAGF